ncbi:MAG: DUF523 domain-containing protein [Bacillota bacterium]|nr:DUF523 domain-containing protein [Bacillota bacterium]
MILISACLIGVNCKYNGDNNLRAELMPLLKEGKLIPVCPEQLGGLPTPRTPVELKVTEAGCKLTAGEAILDNKGNANTKENKVLTDAFIKGAYETLKLAKACKSKVAILKENSPSCGVHSIYNGNFDNNKIPGQGVTAALLKRNGLTIFSDEDTSLIEKYLIQLDRDK